MMSPMTTASEMLAQATAAYKAALRGQTKRHNNREVRNYEIDKLRNEMIFWERRVAAENGGGNRPIRVVL